MKNKMILLISALALFSILLAFFYPKSNVEAQISDEIGTDLEDEAIIPQKIVKLRESETQISTVYYRDKQLGVIHDKEKLNNFLNSVYEEKYAEDYPDSKVGFGQDIHVTDSYTLFEVEDKDDEIIAYINDNSLFSIMGYRVEFSNGAIAYVKNPDDFIKARENFVLNFLEYKGVDPKEIYKMLTLKQTINKESDDGFIDVSFAYNETATITQEFVPIERVLNTYEDCIMWLSFGYDFTPVYAEVVEGDMLQGFAWKNSISELNLISMNPDIVKSENQLLQAGMKLNVAKLEPPIEVEVVKHRTAIERIEPEPTKYIYDDEMREGMYHTATEYKAGSQRSLYEEKYINGEMVEHALVSSLTLEYPVQKVVYVGTRVEPKIGSGNFWWPVDYPSISCGWGCYWGHTAIDIQNRYNKWGNVYASDRGVVVENSYNYVNGYYTIINHNNGYLTYYGHMRSPGYYPVGTTVAQGEKIGDIGMTGVATGPHVHFEVRTGGYGTSQYTCNFLGC